MTDTLAPPNDNWRKAIPLLILAGFVAFSNSFTKAFVLDDARWITEDFTPNQVSTYLGGDLMLSRPVVALTLIANCAVQEMFAGDASSTGHYELGYHAFNLFVHIVAGLALFGVVRRTLLLPHWPQHYRDASTWLAFAVALLWMIHPTQPQSVTYVIQRCESMMGMFMLLGLYCSIRSWDARLWWLWDLTALLCFALGAGCKEVIVGAPLLVPLYDLVIRRERIAIRLLPANHLLLCYPLRRLLFYLGVAIATWGVLGVERYLQAKSWGGWENAVGSTREQRIEYLRTQPSVILHYIKISVWPTNLIFDYKVPKGTWPHITPEKDWNPQTRTVVFLGVLTALGMLLRYWWSFAGAWFFILLAPTSSLVPIDDVAFVQRMYLSLISIVLFVVIVGYGIIHELSARLGWSERVRQGVAYGCLLALGGTLTTLTILRNEDFRTAAALYLDNVAKQPNCGRELYNLSLEESHDDDLTLCIEHCQRALDLYPDDVLFMRHRASLAYTVGDFARAINLYEQVFKNEKDRRQYHLSVLGQCYRAQGKLEKAIEWYRELVKMEPKLADYHLEFAVILDEAGYKAESAKQVQEALKLSTKFPDRINKQARKHAMALPRSDRIYAYLAEFEARQAVLSDDNNPRYLDTLAIAQAANEKYEEAVKTASRALKLARDKEDAELIKGIKHRLWLFKRACPYRVDTARIDSATPENP